MKRFRVVGHDSEAKRGWNSGEGAETLPEALDLLDALLTSEHTFSASPLSEYEYEVVDTEPEQAEILLHLEIGEAIYWSLNRNNYNRCKPTERPWREVLR
jgi:hypothetical protein